jgi:hypothetical protein
MRLAILAAIVPLLLISAAGAAPKADPMQVTERYQRVNQDGCIGEDETASVRAEGGLAPGESFTFGPQEPMCSGGRVIQVEAAWSEGKRGSAPLEVTVAVPSVDWSVTEVGSTPQKGKSHRTWYPDMTLCLIVPYVSFWEFPTHWAVTVENLGSRAARDVVVRGYQTNASRAEELCP